MELEPIELGLNAAIIVLLLIILKKLLDSEGIDLSSIISSNTQVSDTYTKMNQDYAEMTTTLGELNETLATARTENLSIQKFGRDLSDVLKKPSIRGDVGEKLLEEMCREILPDRMWERQAVTDSEASSARGGVDVLIHYDKVDLPVDSKFPREAWRRYINLSGTSMADMNEVEVQTHNKTIKSEFKDFQKAVLSQVGEIQKHINPPDTTDFALMFIPSEAMYYSVISDKNTVNDQNIVKRQGKPDAHLLDVMLEEKVIPVSPSIFYAYLGVIKIGISNLAIVENLEGVRKQVELFKSKKGTYETAHVEVGKMLKKALEEWEKEDKRFNELGKKADDVIGALDKVEIDDTSEPYSEEEDDEGDSTAPMSRP